MQIVLMDRLILATVQPIVSIMVCVIQIVLLNLQIMLITFGIRQQVDLVQQSFFSIKQAVADKLTFLLEQLRQMLPICKNQVLQLIWTF